MPRLCRSARSDRSTGTHAREKIDCHLARTGMSARATEGLVATVSMLQARLTAPFLYAEGVVLHSPGARGSASAPWVAAENIPVSHRGTTNDVRHTFDARCLNASCRTPLGFMNPMIARPRVRSLRSRPWALEYNAFGVKHSNLALGVEKPTNGLISDRGGVCCGNPAQERKEVAGVH